MESHISRKRANGTVLGYGTESARGPFFVPPVHEFRQARGPRSHRCKAPANRTGMLASVLNVCALFPRWPFTMRLWVGCGSSCRLPTVLSGQSSSSKTPRSSHCQCHLRTGENARHSSRPHFPRTVSKLPGWSMVETAAPRFRLRPRPIRPAPTGSPPERGPVPGGGSRLVAGQQRARVHLRLQRQCRRRHGPGRRLSRFPGAASSSPRRLTHLHGGVTSLAFSPDGLHIACLYIEGATRPAGALAPMKPPAGVIGVEGLEIQRVATIETASGEFRQITPAALHVYEYDWAPDSGELAYVAAPPPGENNWWVAQLYTQPLAGGQPQPSSTRTHAGPAARLADRGAPLVAGWAADRVHRWPDERPGSHRRRYLSDLRAGGASQKHHPGLGQDRGLD